MVANLACQLFFVDKALLEQPGSFPFLVYDCFHAQRARVLATETEWVTKLKIPTMRPFAERFASPLLPSVWTRYPWSFGFVEEGTSHHISFPPFSEALQPLPWTGCCFFTPPDPL